MKLPIMALAASAMAAPAAAATVPLDLDKLPTQTVFDHGEMTLFAQSADNSPRTLVLRLPDGKVLPPHGDGESVIVTILSGTAAWGDGSTIDKAKEREFGPGSILLAKGDHWVAARKGDVLMQVVRIAPDGKLTPPLAALQK